MTNKERLEAVERLEELLMQMELKLFYGVDLQEAAANAK